MGARVSRYVPLAQEVASRDFPICQTYLDCVLNGCLEWGGSEAAEFFITSTGKLGFCSLSDSTSMRLRETRLALLVILHVLL